MDIQVQKDHISHRCTFCERDFTRATTLKDHIRTHTNERPYSCKLCASKFRRRNDQLRHESTAHKEKKHVCQGILKSGKVWGCGGRFARVDALKGHWRQEKGKICRRPALEELANEVELAQNDVLYQCFSCSRFCKGLEGLRSHVEIHVADVAERPFHCDCGVSFGFLDMKQRHENPLLEPMCGNGPRLGPKCDPISSLSSGPGAAQNCRKDIRQDWGCGKTFSTHKQLGEHLRDEVGARCVARLKSMEARVVYDMKTNLGDSHPKLRTHSPQPVDKEFDHIRPYVLPEGLDVAEHSLIDPALGVNLDFLLQNNIQRKIEARQLHSEWRNHNRAFYYLLRSFRARFEDQRPDQKAITDRQLDVMFKEVSGMAKWWQ